VVGAESESNPTARRLLEIFDRLLAAIGPRGWWPAETPFEVMVGAVLTQNTAWKNVRQAIDNLKQAGLLSPEAIHRVSLERLARLIKPSGYFNVKAARLKNLTALVMEAGGGDPPRLLRRPPDRLRTDLLAVNGVGTETADSILLYAAGVPIFVIDAYTRRILSRHGLAEPDASYDRLQKLFMDHIPPDTDLYNEYHALLVALGHRFCKPKPLCDECPLQGLG